MKDMSQENQAKYMEMKAANEKLSQVGLFHCTYLNFSQSGSISFKYNINIKELENGVIQ